MFKIWTHFSNLIEILRNKQQFMKKNLVSSVTADIVEGTAYTVYDLSTETQVDTTYIGKNL